jgi:MFS family permease
MTRMTTLQRQLLPLFLANFVMGCMFHFSIVFPFMNDLGFSTSQLIMYALVTNIVILLVEIPSGVIADRWSRKGVLLVSLLSMAVGCILMGAADSYAAFIVATLFTGVYFGMSSGVQEAIVYDVLLEHKDRKRYETLLGRVRMTYTAGLVISSIVGAMVADSLNFRLPFYISAVSCVVALAVLLFFREPRLHREVETAHVKEHLISLVRLLTKHPETRLLVATNIVIGILFLFMVEVDPLWPIALGLATVWFGPLNALLLSSQGLAGLLAGFASLHQWLIRWLGAGLVLAAIGLTIENMVVVVVSLFVLVMCAETLMIILSGRIQDALPSSQRSGSQSAISTVSTVSFVLLLPLFSLVADKQSIFIAAWMIVVVALVGLVGVSRSFQKPTASAT